MTVCLSLRGHSADSPGGYHTCDPVTVLTQQESDLEMQPGTAGLATPAPSIGVQERAGTPLQRHSPRAHVTRAQPSHALVRAVGTAGLVGSRLSKDGRWPFHINLVSPWAGPRGNARVTAQRRAAWPEGSPRNLYHTQTPGSSEVAPGNQKCQARTGRRFWKFWRPGFRRRGRGLPAQAGSVALPGAA